VVGVDGSQRIAGFARQVANANKLGRDVGGPVSIVSSRIEELKSLSDGVDQVGTGLLLPCRGLCVCCKSCSPHESHAKVLRVPHDVAASTHNGRDVKP
jgi:hypothetical protein